MVLVIPQPFDALLRAAQLLSKYGDSNAAREWLEKTVQAMPWDATARRELAAMRKDANQLARNCARSRRLTKIAWQLQQG